MGRPAWFNRRRDSKRNPVNWQRPTIAKSAVRAFLAREREDYNWIKHIPPSELKEFVYSEYNAFHTKPRIAQLAGFAIGMELHDFLFNLDCGVGKTKLILDLIRYHYFANRARRWLVLVPNIINIQAWEDQIETHAPDLTYQPLIGTRKQRHILVNERVQIQLLNYGGLQSYMTELGDGKREVNKLAARDFADLYDGVIYDELHYVGNKQSLTFRLCDRLSKACEFKYGSTATLFGDDPTMMWSQFYLVDRGYTLGETLGLYRAGFFRERLHNFKGIEYVFDRSKEKKLGRFIRNRSLRYTAEECGDMPQVNGGMKRGFNLKERLTWGDEQLTFYNQVRAECKVAGIGKVRLNPHAYTRMRQITSGYVGYEDDNGKAKLVFDHNPKLERLLQIIRQMPRDTKIMVFHQYIFTGRMICEALASRKIPYTELWGGVKDKVGQYNRFLKDEKYRVQVANYKMVAGGNPHVVASYIYFFESPPDPITRKQSEERIIRPGQRRKVFCYDPVMPNSNDEGILDSLSEGRDFYRAVTEGRASA